MKQTNSGKLLGILAVTIVVLSIASIALANNAEAKNLNIKSKKHKDMVRKKICGVEFCSKVVQPVPPAGVGYTATKNNTKCVNPPGGPKYC